MKRFKGSILVGFALFGSLTCNVSAFAQTGSLTEQLFTTRQQFQVYAGSLLADLSVYRIRNAVEHMFSRMRALPSYDGCMNGDRASVEHALECMRFAQGVEALQTELRDQEQNFRNHVRARKASLLISIEHLRAWPVIQNRLTERLNQLETMVQNATATLQRLETEQQASLNRVCYHLPIAQSFECVIRETRSYLDGAFHEAAGNEQLRIGRLLREIRDSWAALQREAGVMEFSANDVR